MLRETSVLVLITGLALLSSGCEQPQDTSEDQRPIKRPNILLIVADDMGYSV